MKQYANPLIRVRQANLTRYRRLLATDLTELERVYIESRIAEEEEAIERLTRQSKPSRERANVGTVVAAHALAKNAPDHRGQ